MKKIKYNEISIENIEGFLKTGLITEFVCDADSKTINISEEGIQKVENKVKVLTDSFKSIADAVYQIGKAIAEAFSKVFLDIKKLLNKKLTKKKFIKLLQSNGIQRNEIQDIIKNNTKEYNYLRYYNTLDKFKKRRKM